jgi:hypothetical protein
MKKQTKSRNLRNNGRRTVSTSNPITVIKQQPMQQRVVRYQNSTSDPVSITRGDLLNWLVSGTDSYANLVVPLCESVRLQRVRLVGFAESGADPTFLSLTWNGDRSPSVLETTALAEAVPAKLSLAPPSSSLASYWSLRGSDEAEVLFTIDVGSVSSVDLFMDLHIEYVLANGATDEFTLSGSTIASAGVFYLTLPNNDANGFSPLGLSSHTIA